MRRWWYSLQVVILAAFTVSTLAADVHQSCDSHRTDVIQALEEAIVMGQNGGDTISKQNTAGKSPAVMDLLYSLLGGKTDQDVLGKGATVTGHLRHASDFALQGPNSTIYCDDHDLIVARPGNVWWNLHTNSTVENFQPCSVSGFAGYTLNDSIIICPRQWDDMTRRKIGPTLSPFRGQIPARALLDDLDTLSSLILHLYLLVGQRDSPVIDAKVHGQPVQGFVREYQLAQDDVKAPGGGDPRSPATQNAVTMVQLAVALYFTEIDFSYGWAILKSQQPGQPSGATAQMGGTMGQSPRPNAPLKGTPRPDVVFDTAISSNGPSEQAGSGLPLDSTGSMGPFDTSGPAANP